MRVIDVTFKMGKNVLFLNDMRAYTIAINIGAWLKAITLLPHGPSCSGQARILLELVGNLYSTLRVCTIAIHIGAQIAQIAQVAQVLQVLVP
jgi:hypothetical protein